MAVVRFIPGEKTAVCQTGDNLLDVAIKAKVFIDAPCSGKGSCGKCKVRIVEGSVDTIKNHHEDPDEIARGYVLACCSRISGDVTVEVQGSQDSYMNNMKIESMSGSRDVKIFEKAKEQVVKNGMAFGSYVKKDYIELAAPDIDDNISDWDRIKRHMRNELGYSKVFCRLPMLRRIPEILRNSDFKVTITHIPRGGDRTTIVNMETGHTLSRLYGVAIDLGTTSVAAFLVDLYEGKLVAKASSGNAQIKYGGDVINRIIYSNRKNGLEDLNYAMIHETINPLLKKMYKDSGVDKDEVIAFVASGNTVMSHLVLGIEPDFLRKEPYVPAFLRPPFIKASELGIYVNPETFLYFSPCVASYVGGDITAGILSTGMWCSDANILFMDLGTNGEIVFGNKDFMLTCACSAGPAFEGGEISCGMRASGGAIEKVEIDSETLEPSIKVIGDEKPRGICGSGIIDVIAEMLHKGIIDRKGRINKDLNNPRIVTDEYGIGEYIIAFKDEWGIERDIKISEVDIDNFIKAKGAVYSGASTLVSSVGMEFKDIDMIYIAGGIGTNIDIKNSMFIGLFPEIDIEKFAYIGNSSLMGSYLTLMSEDARLKLEEIAQQMTYVELSAYPDYMDEFISACFLPHTDIERFPEAQRVLEDK